MNVLLLACPFCGQNATLVSNTNPAKAGCFNPNCGVKPKASSTDYSTAVRKWNDRYSAWIGVKESLPCDETSVVVVSPTTVDPIWTAYFDGRDWRTVSGNKIIVTHWRNLENLLPPKTQ